MGPKADSEYLKQLNEAQREAVMETEGPVMIIAGAGSGKTRVLTYRIAYLLEKGVDPFHILALTFTNKAAREMRFRIENVVGTEARNLWMGTFHSIFSRILRIEGHALGYPRDFSIYDTDDSKSLIKTIIKEMNLDDKLYRPSLVLNRISNAKNSLISSEMYAASGEITAYDQSSGRPFTADIYKSYADRCFKAGAMDFDDLLLKTHELFQKHLNVLNKYQHLFKYVLVDEYQDTNHCQYMIVKKLASVNQNICVVGDDSQSIYSFRGATIKNILTFREDYSDQKVFKLEQNYRSTQNIVLASASVIGRNKDRLEKKLWTANEGGEKIRVFRAVTDNDEAKMVAQAIFEEKMQKQRFNREFAVLYRTNAQSRSFEEAFRKQNIPYRIYGGMSFYQRKEVKDLIAYLRLMVNPSDEEAFKRIVNYPARGIGQTTLDRLILLSSLHGITLFEVAEKAHHFPEFGAAARKLEEFSVMIRSFSTMLNTHNAYDLAVYVAKATGLMKLLHEDKSVEGISRFENLTELLNGIKEFTEDDTSENEKNLPVFLQDIALLTDADQDDANGDRVTVMTVHAAKGLEFPVVFVVGMEENLFPSQLSLSSRSELEEERRLFYVALTRAEKKLTLSYASTRFRYGTLISCEPSRFIEEIDPQYLQVDVSPGPERGLSQRTGMGFYGRQTRHSMQNNGRPPVSPPVFIPPNRKPGAIAGFEPEDTSGLGEGMRIVHQRFGPGVVEKMEGEGDNRKASILFDDFGRKQLVLKFAKLKIERGDP